MEKYYVLTISEDGDVYLEEKTKKELEEELNEEENDYKFFSKIEDTNLMEAGSGSYIFKGTLVTPKDEKIVVRKVLP